MKLISIFLVLLFSCTSNDHNVSDDSAIESVLLSLIDDLSKMINNQNLSFSLNENKIPISKNLLKIIKMKSMKKIRIVSNGDDYQILFTASKDKSRIIAQTSKNLGIKISKIGKICSNKKRSVIIDEKSKEIVLKNKGYVHQF